MKKTIEFKLNNETELPDNFIYSIPRQGPADSSVDELLNYFNIEVSEQDAIIYLESTGGWILDELQDHDTNISRLVWLAALDCQDNKTNFFYMGS